MWNSAQESVLKTTQPNSLIIDSLWDEGYRHQGVKRIQWDSVCKLFATLQLRPQMLLTGH